MLQLNKLVAVKAKRKRVGRGGDRGGMSGRGHDGQKCRPGSGSEIAATFEGGQMPLIRRIPRRGFNNSNFRIENNIVSLDVLSKKFVNGDEINLDALIAKGIFKKNTLGSVKVLGGGLLEKKLTIHANAFSKGAIQAIEKAGGKALVINKETGSGGTATEL
jgi:large subunit ribosomal protein L15